MVENIWSYRLAVGHPLSSVKGDAYGILGRTFWVLLSNRRSYHLMPQT